MVMMIFFMSNQPVSTASRARIDLTDAPEVNSAGAACSFFDPAVPAETDMNAPAPASGRTIWPADAPDVSLPWALSSSGGALSLPATT
jgi:hypothetical protein